ncbi:MAG: hypothetical protein LBR20_06745 [Propionibacteriaceae bacterium]|jgi:hypothetical protein|nr:hypothetical protein [Propionibacteriaceae bacterium]
MPTYRAYFNEVYQQDIEIEADNPEEAYRQAELLLASPNFDPDAWYAVEADPITIRDVSEPLPASYQLHPQRHPLPEPPEDPAEPTVWPSPEWQAEHQVYIFPYEDLSPIQHPEDLQADPLPPSPAGGDSVAVFDNLDDGDYSTAAAIAAVNPAAAQLFSSEIERQEYELVTGQPDILRPSVAAEQLAKTTAYHPEPDPVIEPTR